METGTILQHHQPVAQEPWVCRVLAHPYSSPVCKIEYSGLWYAMLCLSPEFLFIFFGKTNIDTYIYVHTFTVSPLSAQARWPSHDFELVSYIIASALASKVQRLNRRCTRSASIVVTTRKQARCVSCDTYARCKVQQTAINVAQASVSQQSLDTRNSDYGRDS